MTYSRNYATRSMYDDMLHTEQWRPAEVAVLPVSLSRLYRLGPSQRARRGSRRGSLDLASLTVSVRPASAVP